MAYASVAHPRHFNSKWRGRAKEEAIGRGYCLLIKYSEVLALGGAHFTTKRRKYGLKSGGSAVSKGGITRPRKMPVVR